MNCDYNKLTSLPVLPKKLENLSCSHNELTCLPALPDTLKSLHSSYNRINCLPKLPNELLILYSGNNNLTSLPILPKKLNHLDCGHNEIGFIPPLPDKLGYFNYNNIPLFDVLIHNLNPMNPYPQIKKNIDILNNCCNIIHAVKFKKQFRHWLWVRVREPKIKEKYHYKHLLELKEEDELDLFLENW